jgi:hypothetical protein
MIRYELRDMEYLEYRIGKIRREFTDFLRKSEFLKEKEFLNLIGKLETEIHKPQFVKKTTQFIDIYKDVEDSDTEILNYANWLAEKTKRKRAI